ncbi:hypothetical protein [Kaistella carnis]|uniref:Uncharacterized protein n=1 Tax=Kaistella carnis TaxID=1241979 RepID=A0A3G8XHX4_9FLAO|nr:hypothetical protein [Kaistella carnis]AZI32982.1 hypothetical protein EIB73_07265 [Kaistella carnis]
MAKKIDAPEFYKIITKKCVEEAIEMLSTGKHDLKKSTKYDVLLANGDVLPPKEVMKHAALKMGYELKRGTVFGGKAVNNPLKKLGFKIVDKKGNPI